MLQAQVCTTKAAKSSTEMAKSSIDIEVNHLNHVISLEKKWLWAKDREKELHGVLIDAHHKLFGAKGWAIDAEAWVEMVAQESMVAYKASKECQHDRM